LRQRYPDEGDETQSVWRKFFLFIRSAFQYFSGIKQTFRFLMPNCGFSPKAMKFWFSHPERAKKISSKSSQSCLNILKI